MLTQKCSLGGSKRSKGQEREEEGECKNQTGSERRDYITT